MLNLKARLYATMAGIACRSQGVASWRLNLALSFDEVGCAHSWVFFGAYSCGGCMQPPKCFFDAYVDEDSEAKQ